MQFKRALNMLSETKWGCRARLSDFVNGQRCLVLAITLRALVDSGKC